MILVALKVLTWYLVVSCVLGGFAGAFIHAGKGIKQ